MYYRVNNLIRKQENDTKHRHSTSTCNKAIMATFGALDNINLYHMIMTLSIMVLWKNTIHICAENNNIIKKDTVKSFASFLFSISLRFNCFFGIVLEILVTLCSKHNQDHHVEQGMDNGRESLEGHKSPRHSHLVPQVYQVVHKQIGPPQNIDPSQEHGRCGK